jgi:hypothetical protein
MKNTQKHLKNIILKHLNEIDSSSDNGMVDASSLTSSTRIPGHSVDSQIDSFLLGFEKESVMTDSDSLEEALVNGSLSMLIEEEELSLDDAEESAPEEPEEDAEESHGTEADTKSKTVETAPMPKINVETFVDKVMRLSMHAEQMLDVPTVVINRAMKFLHDNYDQEHVNTMIEVLDTHYDIDGGSETSAPDAPFAVGANPLGAGMSGGA